MKVPLLLRNLPRIQKLSSRITNCGFNKVKIARKFASWWAAMYHRRNVFAYQERQRIKEFRNKQVHVRKIQGYDSASSFAKFYGNNFDRT